MKSLLLALCSLLMVAPHAAAYPTLSLGGGYAKDCESRVEPREDGTFNRSCRSGTRGTAVIDLFGSDAPKDSKSSGSTFGAAKVESDGGSGFSLPSNTFNSLGSGGGKGGEVVAIIVLVALAALVAYGVVMAIISLFTAQNSFSLYYSHDHFPDAGTGADGQELSGTMQRYGMQLNLHPIKDYSFRIHMGFGPSSFQAAKVEGDEAEEGDDAPRYRDGLSSKIGLGFTPRPNESGFFVMAEVEQLALYTRTFKDIVDNNNPSKVKEFRVTSAGLAGYSFAF